MCAWVKVCPFSKPWFLPSKETKASAVRWNGVEWWILHTRCLESWGVGEVPSLTMEEEHHCQRIPHISWLVHNIGQGSMWQSIEWITYTSSVKIRKSMDKGAMWYQHECGKLLLRLEACGIWGGKQVHHESARLFPWVELSDPDKRSFHHSAASFVILS